MHPSHLAAPPDPRVEFAGRYLASFLETAAGVTPAQVAGLLEHFERAHRDGAAVFLMGNGGSAAAASHMACDLATNARLNRGDSPWPRLRVATLVDGVPWLTALANDLDYRDVFAEQLRNLARPGDLVVAISVSGDSPNVLEGIRVARELGARVVGLLGKDGGQAAAACDYALVVRSGDYGFVESVHTVLGHLVAAWFAHQALAARGAPLTAAAGG